MAPNSSDLCLKIISYPSESWVLPILVMSCFVLYAGIAAAFFLESWFQIHLFAPLIMIPIISLFSGNTPPLLFCIFPEKNDVSVVWRWWLCTAGWTLKMFAKNYTKTFPYCPESMTPYSETSTELRKLYSQHREQCIAQCYLDVWGYFSGIAWYIFRLLYFEQAVNRRYIGLRRRGIN